MRHWFVTDYASAAAWLQGGRKKHDRPLYSRGLRLQYRSKGNIAVVDRWSGADLVIYHSDDTMTIQAPTVTTHWGSTFNLTRSQGVRQVLREYGNFKDVYQKNYNTYLLEYNHQVTPSKMQGCRSCKSTGKQRMQCWTKSCYGEICQYPNLPLIPQNQYTARQHYWSKYHYHVCEHGNNTDHTYLSETDSCYRCNGVGKAEYGLKPIAMMWDGSPLRIKNGQIINNQPTELEKAIAAYVKTG